MMARIGGGNRVNVQNCRVFIITIVDPTLPAGMDPPLIGRTLAWVQPPSGSVQTGQPAGYAGLRSSSAASPFATGSIALGSDDRHSAGQPILPQLDIGRRRALILERTHAAGAPTGGSGFDGGLTARLCSLDPAPMTLEKVGGVETEGPATLAGGLVVRTGSCHGGPPLLANIPAKCGAFGALRRRDRTIGQAPRRRPPRRRRPCAARSTSRCWGGPQLDRPLPVQARWLRGTPRAARAARAPAHTSPRPRLSRLPPYSLPQRMRPVPALRRPRQPGAPPPARPPPRSPASLSSRRLWRRPRPRRDGQRRRHPLRRPAARLPRTMVRRAGGGEGGGGGGGGGGGHCAMAERRRLSRWAARPARRPGRGSDGGERYDAPRRAAAADAAPLGGRPALFRLVARLRLLRQPDAGTSHPPGGPDAGATVSILARASPPPSATPRRRAAASAG